MFSACSIKITADNKHQFQTGIVFKESWVLTLLTPFHASCFLKILPNKLDYFLIPEQTASAPLKLEVQLEKNGCDNVYQIIQKIHVYFSYNFHEKIINQIKQLPFSDLNKKTEDDDDTIRFFGAVLLGKIFDYDDMSCKEFDLCEVISLLMDLNKHTINTNEINRDSLHVVTEFTPFGYNVFFNSWYRGIVNNLIPSENNIFLLNKVLGKESHGAPVYLWDFDNNTKGAITGLICCELDANSDSMLVSIVLNLYELMSDCLHTISKVTKTAIRIEKPRKFLLNDIKLSEDFEDIPQIPQINSIVQIQSGDSFGSGMAINEYIVLTAMHVIEDVTDIHVYSNGVKKKGLAIDALDNSFENNDIVFIFTVGGGLEPISFSSENIPNQKGKRVWLAGFPVNSNIVENSKICITSGNIMLELDFNTLVSNPVHPGFSGGAALNKKGELIGHIISSTDVGNGSHITFVYPISHYKYKVDKILKAFEIGQTTPNSPVTDDRITILSKY